MIKKTSQTGLTTAEANELLNKYGRNELSAKKKENFFLKLLHIICEPMFLLLIIAAVIYFLLGEARDGIIMLMFVIGIISIDAIQEWKTDRTLNALKELSSPHTTVIRDGEEKDIPSTEIVPGDLMIIFEGVKISADGYVVKCADLCTDESSLTGEAEGVWKNIYSDDTECKEYWRKDYCYAGTLVTQGSAVIQVDKTGTETEYGKIGKNIATAEQTDTPLQKQIGRLVKTCAVIAGILFLFVALFTWLNLNDHATGERLTESILSGVTLAMAMIPEEFPVVLTVFLSMGAWRLAKKNSLVRKLPSVETLGAVSVLCVDKTGTITMNQMAVEKTWSATHDENKLIRTMILGCETDAYDPMEEAMLRYGNENGISSDELFSNEFVTEYPFTNELKMMGHVWRTDGKLVIAVKGSPERVLTICNMTDGQRETAEQKINELSAEGLRVIAIATAYPEDDSRIPAKITDCRLEFLGLVAMTDPPRENVKNDIEVCNKAGIRVVMITGDNGITASAIAKKVGIPDSDNIITGDMLEKMTDEELREAVKTVSIFSRVIPEHKMRIVKAFRENGEITAMTGDGVNDAPALKSADIGIAMGGRGSEVSREASDLILMDDNFTTIVETVRDGRRIYDNIRKAVGYIFSIHIPIAFASVLAPVLKIAPTALLLLPLHVVLLEILIDPTCSIVLERQPAEENIMERPPRNPEENLLSCGLLTKSILQGILVFVASFVSYFVIMDGNPENAPVARAMGLAVIMIANIFLVLVNSSDNDIMIHSVKRLAKDGVMWAVIIGTVALLGIILYTPLNSFLKLAPISPVQLLIAFGLALASVIWYDAVKLIKRKNHK